MARSTTVAGLLERRDGEQNLVDIPDEFALTRLGRVQPSNLTTNDCSKGVYMAAQ
jgi:hypothetical protein